MRFTLDDTIAAIASAPGPAFRGIIRVSGPDTPAVLNKLLMTESWQGNREKQSRRISILIPVGDGRVSIPADLLYWPTARSFTGETLGELHLVGSPPLLNEVLAKILVNGARPAEKGEFTLRAFLAGRIDLVQAEAVLGVIDAGDSGELKTALAQLAGGISTRMADLREELLLHLADLEAGLDFVEEDIEFVAREELTRRLNAAHSMISALLLQASGRMQSHGRKKVVLAGLPNAGKSTLFNRLVGKEAALVSPIAGTTRDYLSAPVSHSGVTFELIDTAGWEQARDGIEAAAAELRSDQLQRADLVVWCTSAEDNPESLESDEQLYLQCREVATQVLRVRTKADQSSTNKHADKLDDLSVSVQEEIGLEEMLDGVVKHLSSARSDAELIGATAARCRESLQHSLLGIERALELIEIQAGDELISLELRDVLDQLGRILGQVYTDDILDRIFSRFCIGK
ncbi:tRNA modification GTPase [Planctomicrobium sp. SH668]|uniref:tRNA modification GTPase n=1 Tax=Planctomicrobium sp. SH668 TaxID=3448126 RepID=UPI003F5B3721